MRIIVLPFVLATILISFNYQAIIRCINFVKYGGELVDFKKDDKQTMREILELFKHLREKTSNS